MSAGDVVLGLVVGVIAAALAVVSAVHPALHDVAHNATIAAVIIGAVSAVVVSAHEGGARAARIARARALVHARRARLSTTGTRTP